jgi:hypothetical protein
MTFPLPTDEPLVLRAGVLLAAMLAGLLACADGADDEGTDPGGNSGRGGDSPAEQVCAARCAREVAAACPNTTADHASACEDFCLDKYDVYPECEASLLPLDQCRVDRATYTCDSTGTVTFGPIGICGSEGLECSDCTGNLLNCL